MPLIKISCSLTLSAWKYYYLTEFNAETFSFIDKKLNLPCYPYSFIQMFHCVQQGKLLPEFTQQGMPITHRAFLSVAPVITVSFIVTARHSQKTCPSEFFFKMLWSSLWVLLVSVQGHNWYPSAASTGTEISARMYLDAWSSPLANILFRKTSIN